MSQTKIRYLPALDGLRALAVAGVICYHGGLAWAGGGFLGVDAFFVLSGYLITTLLLTEWRSSSIGTEWNATGRIDLKAFWARRARRLLPALLLVLGAVAVYAVLVAAPGELRTIRADGIASLFYIANWRFIWSGASYFAQFGAPSPLRHFWSLAIEEQFYLLWPLIVFGILRWRRGSIRALAGFATVAAIGSAVLMWTMYVPGQDPSRVYYGTDTRASSLLVGALLGMLMLRRPVVEGTANRWILHGAGIVAAVVLGYWWSTATEHSDWLYRGGFVIAAVLVAVVIASITQPKYGPLGHVLALKPLRFIGLISYGLYLWHWPVFIALSPTRVPLDGYALFAVRVAATLTIATLSYYLIEMPIRHGALEAPAPPPGPADSGGGHGRARRDRVHHGRRARLAGRGVGCRGQSAQGRRHADDGAGAARARAARRRLGRELAQPRLRAPRRGRQLPAVERLGARLRAGQRSRAALHRGMGEPAAALRPRVA